MPYYTRYCTKHNRSIISFKKNCEAKTIVILQMRRQIHKVFKCLMPNLPYSYSKFPALYHCARGIEKIWLQAAKACVGGWGLVP